MITFTCTETSVTEDGSDLKIFVRSKRFMSKMPKMPTNLQHFNGTVAQSADLKDSSKNISLVLADLLDDYDYNQRPGYGGKKFSGPSIFLETPKVEIGHHNRYIANYQLSYFQNCFYTRLSYVLFTSSLVILVMNDLFDQLLRF